MSVTYFLATYVWHQTGKPLLIERMTDKTQLLLCNVISLL